SCRCAPLRPIPCGPLVRQAPFRRRALARGPSLRDSPPGLHRFERRASPAVGLALLAVHFGGMRLAPLPLLQVDLGPVGPALLAPAVVEFSRVGPVALAPDAIQLLPGERAPWRPLLKSFL